MRESGWAALRDSPRKLRIGAACGALAAAALAVGIVIGAGPETSSGASPAAKPSGATTVQRRNLVSTDTESGTLTYANPQTVFNRLSGTITWLPQIGQLIKPGQALYDVDNQPVVLFSGTTPAYRDLSSSDTAGPDILELNRELKQMGFDSSHEIAVNDTWQAGTTNAVEAWQSSLGQTQSGTITLGQVVFLPGTQRVTSVSTVLGSTGGAGASSGAGAGTGSSSAGSSSGASGAYAPRTEFVSLTMTRMGPASASARAAAADSLSAAWAQACAAHDLPRLRLLKRHHAALLKSERLAACRERVAPGKAGVPAAPSAAPPAASPQRSEPATATSPTASAPTTTPISPPAEPSVLTPTWSANMAKAGSHPTRTGSGTSPVSSGSLGSGGSPGSGGSRNENKQILRALAALLKAEALLLQRSAGSAGKGASAGAGTSGLRASSAASGAGSGSARSAGASAASAGSGAGASAAAGGGSGSGSAGSGSAGGGSAQAILATTSNQLDVVVNLDATKQSEAVLGEPVTVQMPDGSTVNGKITEVSPVAQSSSSGSGSGSGSGSSSGGSSGTPSATVPVTIVLRGRVPSSGLDQAAVSVNFEQQVANNVLSVPVTALLATQGGGYAVQEALAPHKLIPVTPGLFAAGYVQVSSARIYPGLAVTDSQG